MSNSYSFHLDSLPDFPFLVDTLQYLNSCTLLRQHKGILQLLLLHFAGLAGQGRRLGLVQQVLGQPRPRGGQARLQHVQHDGEDRARAEYLAIKISILCSR